MRKILWLSKLFFSHHPIMVDLENGTPTIATFIWLYAAIESLSFPIACPLSQTLVCLDCKLLWAMARCLTLTLSLWPRDRAFLISSQMPQSTQRATYALIEECVVQASSLLAFYNDFAHAMDNSDLITERKSSPEINSHCGKERREGEKVNWHLQMPSIYS